MGDFERAVPPVGGWGLWPTFRHTESIKETSEMKLPSRLHIWRNRTLNRWYDLRAILTGYCNHRPYSPVPGEGGGYAHWRCSLPRRHDGMHRGRNYVWSDDGRTSYLPVPHGQHEPSQPWERSMTMTRRQARQRDRWLNRRYAEMQRTR